MSPLQKVMTKVGAKRKEYSSELMVLGRVGDDPGKMSDEPGKKR